MQMSKNRVALGSTRTKVASHATLQNQDVHGVEETPASQTRWSFSPKLASMKRRVSLRAWTTVPSNCLYGPPSRRRCVKTPSMAKADIAPNFGEPFFPRHDFAFTACPNYLLNLHLVPFGFADANIAISPGVAPCCFSATMTQKSDTWQMRNTLCRRNHKANFLA